MSALDWLMPHQANIRILQTTARRLDLPMESVVITVDFAWQHVGGVGAAGAGRPRCATDASARDSM
jgi:3-oxoacyl-[acyl-carrier-protein] synthase III